MKISVKSAAPAFNLNNLDPLDIMDIVHKIEASFDIKFGENELKDVVSVSQLCDVVVSKVKQAHAGSCTTQQAFYKLRNAISAKNPIDKCALKPQTRLCELFPRDNRIEVVADIEQELGFHMNLLRPKPGIVAIFGTLLVLSLAAMWINPTFASAGLVVSLAGLRLAGRFGKELKVKTIGDLAEKIAREHYLKCRRDASTVNRAEIHNKVKELFAGYFPVEPGTLTRQARFA